MSTTETAPLTLHTRTLHEASLPQLLDIAGELDITDGNIHDKRNLISKILQAQINQEADLYSDGMLQILPDGFGFLRRPETNYLPSKDDIYISPSQIRRFGLRSCDTIAGYIRPPRNGERYFALTKIDAVNLADPSNLQRRNFYRDLTPLHPQELFRLEHRSDEMSTRIMDLLCPIGKGQRGLIVSPPRAGKTMLLKHIAQAITQNHPETVPIVLLIDERPEEVTEMIRSIDAEVVASCFDEPAARHTEVAELVIDKARRIAEHGQDVVILLDSITRLARAYNNICPPSSKILSGGVDAKALHKPKRFFGAARNIEEGGSLTIVATALTETGSRMDDVIFEEFKGTGNAEIVLDRRLADQYVWPAIDINRSGTRKEELLLSEDALSRSWVLRKVLQPLGPVEAIQLLVDRLGKTDQNTQFIDAMSTMA